MKSEQINYFLEAAEFGSMLQVAQKNFMSQPAVSKAIAELEKELGVKLLNRSRQGTSLTEAGKIACETFAAMQTLLAELDVKLAPFRMAQIHEEPIRIEVYTTLEMNAAALKMAMTQFTRIYPQATFEIKEYDFLEMMAILSRKPSAFGVFSILKNILENPSIQEMQQKYQMKLLTSERGQLFVVLSEDAALAQKKSISFKELLHHPLAIFKSGDGESWHELFLQQHGISSKPICTNRPSYLLDLAKNHGYVVFLLDYQGIFSATLHQHGLTIRPITDNLPVVSGIMHHEEATFSSPINDFLHCIEQCLKEGGARGACKPMAGTS